MKMLRQPRLPKGKRRKALPSCVYRTSPLGDCSHGGDVRLVMRGKVNGQWDDQPRRYVYGTLVPLVLKMAEKDYNTFFYANYKAGKGDVSMVRGFRAAWLKAFLERISERFDEARKAAIAATTPIGASSTALVRLNGAMVKVQDYIDNRFHQKRRYANPLSQLNGRNDTGRQMGRAAADRLDIGRKAITTSSTQALRLRG